MPCPSPIRQSRLVLDTNANARQGYTLPELHNRFEVAASGDPSFAGCTLTIRRVVTPEDLRGIEIDGVRDTHTIAANGSVCATYDCPPGATVAVVVSALAGGAVGVVVTSWQEG